MRPIVSFCGSPTYQLYKYLTTILQPLANNSRHKRQCTETLVDVIKTVRTPDKYRLVSFDMRSLFTSIPLQLVLECTDNCHQTIHRRTSLTNRRHHATTGNLFQVHILSIQRQTLPTATRNCQELTSFCCGC